MIRKIAAKDFWNKRARFFTQYEDKDYDPLKDPYLNSIRETVSPTAKVIEVGCGGGMRLREFKKAGYEFTGVDGSPKMLALAKKKGIDPKSLHLLDLEKDSLPGKDREFDAAISARTIFYIKRGLFVIEEMLRVTKAGGAVVFGIIHAKGKGLGQEFEANSDWLRFERTPYFAFDSESLFDHLEKDPSIKDTKIIYDRPVKKSGHSHLQIIQILKHS